MKNLFGPKTCKYNINTLDDVFRALDDVCNKAKTFTDDELANELSDIHNFCAGGHDGKQFYFITHGRSTKLVEQRAKKYCKKHRIKLEDYNGILPYNNFLLDIEPDLQRKEKLNKIKNNINNEKHKYKESLIDYFKRIYNTKTLIPRKR